MEARLWLPDDKSNPKLVPGFSVGNFLDVVEGKFPLFTFEQVLIRAKVKPKHVELEAEFKVNLHAAAQQQAIAIPLRLENCQLTEPVYFKGNSQQTVDVSPKQGGYVWHLQLKESEQRSIRLVAQTVLATDQDRQQLALSLPDSPCLLELELPQDATDVRLGQQSSGLITMIEQPATKKAEIRCTGDINVSWRIGEAPRSMAPIEVHSLTRFEFDNPSAVWVGTSNLDIRRTRRDQADQLLIRLPPGARLLPSPNFAESYTINAAANNISPNSPKEKVSSVDLVVRFLRPDEQYRLLLKWEWRPQNENTPQGIWAVPGIIIPDADLHEGRMEISMPNYYSLLDQQIGEGTELENQRNEVGLDRKLYAFRFSRQPFSLNTKIGRDSALAGVRPTYLVEVEQGKLKLTAWLSCSFEPSQELVLGLRFQDWSLASAESITGSTPTLQFESLAQTRLADGTIQLRGIDNTDGVVAGKRIQQNWKLVAFWPHKIAQGTSVGFSIPQIVRYRPDGGKPDIDHGSGTLLVAGARNCLLRWDEQESQALFSDSLSPQQAELLGEDLSSRATAFRFQSGGDAVPRWRAVVDVLPQQITVEQHLACKVELNDLILRQKAFLQVDHVPLNELKIAANYQLQELRVTVDEKECELRPLTATPTDGGVQQFQLIGSSDLIGKVAIEFSSRLPLVQSATINETLPLVVPIISLVLPTESRRLPGEVQISHSRDIEIWHSLGTEHPQSLNSLSEQGKLPFEFAANVNELHIGVRRIERVQYFPVQIERVWLQTAINGSDRRDRFCARLRTEQKQLTLVIPDPNPQIYINGTPVEPFRIAVDRFQIDLPSPNPTNEYALDIWTWPPGAIDWISPHVIGIPQIENGQVVNRFYWQLITPYVYHLAIAPHGFVPEWQWAWNGFWWSRQSRIDQQELENWVGVTNQPSVASASNQYVMSSFGTPKSVQCWTISRLLLWFPVGAISILATMLAMSISFLRSPFVIVTVAASFAGLAMVWPDLAILIGQTLLVSIGLVAMMIITRAAVDTRVRRRSVFTSRPQSTADRGSERQSGSRPVTANPPTTQVRSPISIDRGA